MSGAIQGLWGRLVALGRRVLGWLTRAVTSIVTTSRTLGHRLRDLTNQATGGIRDRHAHHLEHDRRYRPALAAGLTAALSVLAPHPAVAAGLAVLVAEHLQIRDSDHEDVRIEPDEYEDGYDRYDPRRAWTPQQPRSSPSRPPGRPLWDAYND